MMRSSCGSNDHPDSVIFMQIFRLISTYSLVKPPKRSNISGGEILSSLFSVHDPNMSSFNVQEEHNYTIIDNTAVTSDPVLAYISGYVARKFSTFTKCSFCLDSLKTSETFSRDILIKYKSHGNLLKPSTHLFNLIKLLKTATLKVMETEELSTDTIFKILIKFEEIGSARLVGCSSNQHKTGINISYHQFFFSYKDAFYLFSY